MADDEDRQTKTVKGISAAAWSRGLAAAQRRGEPYGAWLARAIERQAEVEMADRVIPPDERGQTGPQSALSVAPVLPPADLADLMRAAAAVADASGVPVPKVAARHAFALLTAGLRAARGLPPVKPRVRIGQTVEG